MTIIREGSGNVDLDFPVCSPTLNLDFTNSQSLDERIIFTRGSIGTRVNSMGFIETIQANQPRFDYDPVTGECKGLLIEQAGTNLVADSVNLSGTIQQGSTRAITSETTSPDGTFNAYKLVSNVGAKNRQSMYISLGTLSANSAYTISVFLKATPNIRYAVMWFDGTGPGNAPIEGQFYGSSTFIDLFTGTTSNPSITKIINYGNDWWRCYITCNVGGSPLTGVSLNVSIGSPNGYADIGNPAQYKYIGDGTAGIYYWGPQAEISAFPTTYIPTTGSTVTRSSDNATMTGTNFSSWYNPIEGTLDVSFAINALGGTGYAGVVYVDDGTLNNCIGAVVNDFAGDVVAFEGYVSARNQYYSFTGPAITVNKLYKAASSYSTNDFSSAFNGIGTIQRDISGSIPVVNTLRIGDLRGGNGKLNGTISHFTYYPRALPPSQLIFLTT